MHATLACKFFHRSNGFGPDDLPPPPMHAVTPATLRKKRRAPPPPTAVPSSSLPRPPSTASFPPSESEEGANSPLPPPPPGFNSPLANIKVHLKTLWNRVKMIWVKPNSVLRGKMRKGDFLEFSFSPRKVSKNRFEMSSDAAYIFPMPLIHFRCRLHIPDAAYIFPMQLI